MKIINNIIIFLFIKSTFLYSNEEIYLLQEIFEDRSLFSNAVITLIPSFTNRNYLIDLHEIKYVLRIPGQETNFYINRYDEYKNASIAYNYGFNPAEIVYFNIDTGSQLTKYVDKSDSLNWKDFYNPEIIVKAVLLLNKLHYSGIQFENVMNPFDRIEKLIKKISHHKFASFAELVNTKQIIDQIQVYYLTLYFSYVPAHNDPVPSNFVITHNGWGLFDWECSGMNDPAWDLAMLISVMDYSLEQENFVVSLYEDTSSTNEIKFRVSLLKPVVEFWIGLWAFVESEKYQEQDKKDFFKRFSIARMHKAKRYFQNINLIK